MVGDSLWEAVIAEPHTGVSIVTIDGTVLYMNDQLARIFHGEGATASRWIDQNLSAIHPQGWVTHRLATLRRVNATGKPALVRVIWQGRQHHTWIYPIGAEGVDESDPSDLPGKATPDRFLTITRFVEGEGPPRLSEEGYEYSESDWVDLGPLKVLSPREVEVLALIGQGMSNKEIAASLFRSVKTIDNHRASIGAKLQVAERVGLAAIAHRAGLTLRDAERERL